MTENVSRDYFFRVHSYATGGSTPNDKSPSVGHFGIELVTPDGQSLNLGLYPRTKDDPQSTHSGIIRDDGKVKAEFSNLESSKKITLTPEQGEKMRAFLINAMESPGDYSLLGRNCEEFVQEALKASDIKARTEDFMTDKQRSHFNLAKLTMVNPDEDPKLRHAQDALRADKERYNPDSTDIAPEQTEQKQAAPDTGREAEPDQRSDAGDAQQQQFAEANADTGIETGIDTGGGNNGRNYAAELAALPLGRELSQAWLLQKDPSLWSEQELEDAQALDRVEAMPEGLPELTRNLKRQAARDLVQRIDPAAPPEDLAGQLNDAVNVFRDLYRPHAGSVRQLQQGLNRLGRESMGLNEGWQPIAEDGDLGPQTAGGFAALAKRLPADSMASLFDFGTEPFRGQSRGTSNSRAPSRAPSQMPALSARDPNPRQRLRAGML